MKRLVIRLPFLILSLSVLFFGVGFLKEAVHDQGSRSKSEPFHTPLRDPKNAVRPWLESISVGFFLFFFFFSFFKNEADRVSRCGFQNRVGFGQHLLYFHLKNDRIWPRVDVLMIFNLKAASLGPIFGRPSSSAFLLKYSNSQCPG